MKLFILLIATFTAVVAEVAFTLDQNYYNLPHLLADQLPHSSHLIYPAAPVLQDVLVGIPFPPVHYEVPPYYVPYKSQYDDRDIIGQAKYGHVEPGQSHHAFQDAFGNKIGSFSYYNAEGKLKQTNYIADAAGYRVASNDLPIDTPEVTAAKLAHFAEHAAARYRGRRDVSSLPSFQTGDVHYSQDQPFPHAYPTTNLQPIVTKDGFLQETPEVLAAKADHFARVADSRARIESVGRSSGNAFNRPSQSYDNSINFYSHRTMNPLPTQQSFDYLYDQQQTFTNTIPQETVEVLAAKAKHFAELAANRARGVPLVQPFQQTSLGTINTPVKSSTSFQSLDYSYAKPFPQAYPTTNLQPAVTSDGFLQETPEVLAAKSNHFAQHAYALNRALI